MSNDALRKEQGAVVLDYRVRHWGDGWSALRKNMVAGMTPPDQSSITVIEIHPENLSDREKIGKAMGWRLFERSNGDVTDRWWFPAGENPKAGYPSHPLPDPFTDANDDYAVLEWFRNGNNIGKYEYPDFGAYFSADSYQIGDYARAALTVLDQSDQRE